MQITLPDDRQFDQQLRRKAQAAGFASVDEYVLQLLVRDVEQAPAPLKSRPGSAEEWVRDFREFIQSIPPGNPNFDDSREAMYPVR